MSWNEPGNLTGFQEMFAYVSENSNMIFPNGIILCIWVIVFIATKVGGLETPKSALLASFITFALSVVGYAAKFIPGKLVLFLFGITIICFIWERAVSD